MQLHFIKKLAICKCVTDTTGTEVVSQGNRCAEGAVEQTVQQPLTDVLIATETILDHNIPVKMQNNSPPTEKTEVVIQQRCKIARGGSDKTIKQSLHYISLLIAPKDFVFACEISAEHNQQGNMKHKPGRFPQ